MRHLLRRLIFYLVALWLSITLNFFLPRWAPGNPVQALIGRLHVKPTPQTIRSLEILLGVNNHDSLWTQYLQYLSSLAHGNLGVSITYFKPVSSMIAQDLPWTLTLVGVTLIISFVFGTFLGIIVAWYRGSKLDTIFPPIFTFLSAIPYFWLALIIFYVFGFVLKWFPSDLQGYDIYETSPGWNMAFISSAITHAILPAFTIIIGSIAGWLLGMRNMMITTLSEDYVLMAEAKGLPQRRIMFTYAARNAILPNITSFALSLGFVVSGALLTELVFNYPGIGFRFLEAVNDKDYPLIQGLFLIIALAVLVANFLSDLLYVVLDPRIRR